jgi:hypothetical protein
MADLIGAEYICTCQNVVGEFNGFTTYEACSEPATVRDDNDDWYCEHHAEIYNIKPEQDSPTFGDYDSDRAFEERHGW